MLNTLESQSKALNHKLGNELQQWIEDNGSCCVCLGATACYASLNCMHRSVCENCCINLELCTICRTQVYNNPVSHVRVQVLDGASAVLDEASGDMQMPVFDADGEGGWKEVFDPCAPTRF